MLRLIRLISVSQLRTAWGRATLVVAGIAVGVTLMVAIDVVNGSVVEHLRRTIELMAGPAALEVTLGLGEVGFAESTADVVRADPDVTVAVPLVRGTVALAEAPGETLDLVGADLLAEEDLQRYRIATTTERRALLRAMEDPRSILLTTALARARGLDVGSAVRLSTPSGLLDVTVATSSSSTFPSARPGGSRSSRSR